VFLKPKLSFFYSCICFLFWWKYVFSIKNKNLSWFQIKVSIIYIYTHTCMCVSEICTFKYYEYSMRLKYIVYYFYILIILTWLYENFKNLIWENYIKNYMIKNNKLYILISLIFHNTWKCISLTHTHVCIHVKKKT